jgi:transcriptional regulator with XRE-family HTH domain
MPGIVVHVGENLRRLRTLNALTQEQLAARAGLTRSAVQRAESDQTEPHMTTLRKLADALEVHPRELVEGSKDA